MKYISILLSTLAVISCSSDDNHVYESGEFKDSVVIEYTDSKDTLIIDTSKVVKKMPKICGLPNATLIRNGKQARSFKKKAGGKKTKKS